MHFEYQFGLHDKTNKEKTDKFRLMGAPKVLLAHFGWDDHTWKSTYAISRAIDTDSPEDGAELRGRNLLRYICRSVW